MQRKLLTPDQTAAVVRDRRRGLTVGGQHRAFPLNSLSTRYGVPRYVIVSALKAAGSGLYKPHKTAKKNAAKLEITIKTPPRIIPLRDQIKDMPLEDLLDALRTPSEKDQAILREINSGDRKSLTYGEAASLLGIRPRQMRDLIDESREARAGKPDDPQAKAAKAEGPGFIPLPLRFKSMPRGAKSVIDAKGFMPIYDAHRNLVLLSEATAITTGRYGKTRGAMPAFFRDLPIVPAVLKKGAFDRTALLERLRAYDQLHGLDGGRQQVVAAWARNRKNYTWAGVTGTQPPSGRTRRKLRKVSLPTLRERIPGYLQHGIFDLSEERLARTYTRDADLHSGRHDKEPMFQRKKNGAKPVKWLAEDCAALSMLGIHSDRLLQDMTHSDRRALGKAVSRLMRSGEVPLYLPHASGDEKLVAYRRLAEALALPTRKSPVLKGIAGELEMRVRMGLPDGASPEAVMSFEEQQAVMMRAAEEAKLKAARLAQIERAKARISGVIGPLRKLARRFEAEYAESMRASVPNSQILVGYVPLQRLLNRAEADPREVTPGQIQKAISEGRKVWRELKKPRPEE